MQIYALKTGNGFSIVFMYKYLISFSFKMGATLIGKNL